MSITIFYYKGGEEFSEKSDRYFAASANPFYLGLIVSPSSPVWTFLKSEPTVSIRTGDGEEMEFSITYRIEVGENTILFAKPAEEYSKKAESAFLS